MTQSQTRLDDIFLTTNQDYGSFYSGRLQTNRIDPKRIALELSINDQVRNERRCLPSIAYDLLFDKHQSLKIVAHNNKHAKSITTRRHLKYIKSTDQTNEERQGMIKNALEYYNSLIKCIYSNRHEENPQYSMGVLEALANELLLLHPNLSANELGDNLIAITVPLRYLGMPSINPNKPYPGSQADCTQTPRLQHLLDHIQSAKDIVADAKQPFDALSISCQPMHGIRYIYNPFKNVLPTTRI